MKRIALVCGILSAACMTARDSSRPSSSDTVAVSNSQTSDTSARTVTTRTSMPDSGGPAGGRLGALRDSLAQFPNDPRVPSWLWKTGMRMLERFAVVDGSSPAAAFAQQHPEEFVLSESDGAFFYTHYHFRELVRRFPKHELADDAAYRLTDPVVGGECEGYVPCYIEYRMAFTALNAFLAQFPTSEYAGEAVRRADSAFTSVLADELANADRSETLDAQAVDSLLNAYSSTVAALPDSLSARSRAAIDSARRMLNRLAPAHR